MSNWEYYRWNVRIEIAGFTFNGPGMESENEAQAIADALASESSVDDVEVFRQ